MSVAQIKTGFVVVDASQVPSAHSGWKQHIPDLPLVIWMVFLALLLGLGSKMDAEQVVMAFNAGFGRALGEFALILLPSFTLAAALSRRNIASNTAGRTVAMVAPVAGAGMICPDTAYAALSPAAGHHKIDTAFGAYAGFKLLYPAGPLIVAAGLGVSGDESIEPSILLLCGVLLALPVWGSGVIWGRIVGNSIATMEKADTVSENGQLWRAFLPFLVMAVLLIAGGIFGTTGSGLFDFFLKPKGALIIAAILALGQTPIIERRACLDSAVRRTGSLLLIIGAASAFGAMVTALLPVDRLMPQGNGMTTLIALFGLTALFKLAQGSSMATFAAIGPVAAPIVMSSGVAPIAAVFAICLGSFIAILPNDSYYWLVRRDALDSETGEGRAVRILTGGAVVQAFVGMSILLLVVGLWPR